MSNIDFDDMCTKVWEFYKEYHKGTCVKTETAALKEKEKNVLLNSETLVTTTRWSQSEEENAEECHEEK